MSWSEQDEGGDDGRAARIGVVDDDAAVRHAMANLLEAGGYAACLFESGEAFLAQAGSHALDFDVLIFDVKLRGMNGFALQERVAAAGSTVPLLFISGHSDRAMAARAMGAGALALLRKPVDPDVLFAHIEQALATRGKQP
jgi:FixJ family two-component response regulator